MYRLEQEFNRQGLKLSRQTMANWLLKASEKWLQPVYDVLHEQLCREAVLHADETTLQVLKEPGRSSASKSYMWLYRTSGCAKQAIVLYEYQPTRKAEHAEAFLKGFSGWLHADGYQGDTTDCRGTSVWWAAGHMRGENLTRYLEDGRLELSNNRAERSMKPFVMGGKNWLFANTPGGAQASSVIYSLIETAKEDGLYPYRYLLWVLRNAPQLSETDEAWAEKLLPANAPEECYMPHK